MGKSRTILGAGCAALVFAGEAGATAPALSTETIIHNFAAPTGESPVIGPVMDASSGAFYGATWSGGTTGYGVIYQLLSPTATNKKWTYTVISNNPVNYADPYVIVVKGVVYVSSHFGGAAGCSSCGSIFTLTPPASGTGD
jgi:hypothetical protein